MISQKWVFAFLILLLVAILLPSTYRMGSLVLARLPGQPALDLLLQGNELSEEGFDRIRDSRQEALAFDPTGQDYIELGLSQVFESLIRQDLTDERAHELRMSAVQSLRQGLARSPVSYNGWYALALGEFLLDNLTESAEAFEATMLLTPYAAHNLTSRLQLGMAMWQNLSMEAQDQLEREIIFTTRYEPFDMARLTVETGTERQVRALLASAPDGPKLLERFGQVQVRLMREALLEAGNR